MFKGICVGTLLEVFLERTNNRVESKDTPNETQPINPREATAQTGTGWKHVDRKRTANRFRFCPLKRGKT